MARAPSSGALKCAREPRNFPVGVRTAPTMTACSSDINVFPSRQKPALLPRRCGRIHVVRTTFVLLLLYLAWIGKGNFPQDFAGSWPMWKLEGTCISHIESETCALCISSHRA